jgi:hypothetical protein
MKTPTKKQIDQQLAALKKMKPRVLHYSGFGDDHHAAIDAQVNVLENRLSENDLYDKKDECYEQECSGEDGINWHVDNIFEGGVEAAKWLAGESDFKTLTENWEPLMDRDPATILRPKPLNLNR